MDDIQVCNFAPQRGLVCQPACTRVHAPVSQRPEGSYALPKVTQAQSDVMRLMRFQLFVLHIDEYVNAPRSAGHHRSLDAA